MYFTYPHCIQQYACSQHFSSCNVESKIDCRTYNQVSNPTRVYSPINTFVFMRTKHHVCSYYLMNSSAPSVYYITFRFVIKTSLCSCVFALNKLILSDARLCSNSRVVNRPEEAPGCLRWLSFISFSSLCQVTRWPSL